ncbi:MAG: ABC transporter permease [Actinomycetota bacterium]
MISTLSAARTIYVRNLKKMARTPIVIFFSLFQPLLFLLLLGQSFKRLADLPGFPYASYLAFFAPSVIMLTALNSSLQSGMGTVDDIESGFLDKLLTAPIRRSAVLLGKIMSDGTRILLQGAMVIGVSYALGFRVETGLSGIVLMVAIAAGFGVAWAGLSNIVALRSRNSEATMMFGIILSFPILFLSNAMMPEQLLPDWLKTVSDYNPASYMITALRALANSGFDWSVLGQAAVIIAAVGLLTFAGAVRLFRKVAV